MKYKNCIDCKNLEYTNQDKISIKSHNHCDHRPDCDGTNHFIKKEDSAPLIDCGKLREQNNIKPKKTGRLNSFFTELRTVLHNQCRCRHPPGKDK